MKRPMRAGGDGSPSVAQDNGDIQDFRDVLRCVEVLSELRQLGDLVGDLVPTKSCVDRLGGGALSAWCSRKVGHAIRHVRDRGGDARTGRVRGRRALRSPGGRDSNSTQGRATGSK
jgi:hypothetical protein